MLDCSACIQRCIRTAFSDVLTSTTAPPLTPPAPPRRLRLYHAQSWNSARRYATEAFQQRPTTDSVPAEIISSSTLDPDVNAAFSKPSRPPGRHYSESNLKRELAWLSDPLRLAQEVGKQLKLDTNVGYEKAEGLVRLASKNMACTVSWNHLIDYDMSKGYVKRALKHYNEVGTCSW